MIVVAWNVRVCNDPIKRRDVCRRIRLLKPDVFALIETKIKENNVSRILDEFEDFNSVNNFSKGGNGRIIVFWKKEVKIKVNLMSNQLIDIKCCMVDGSYEGYVSFIYATNDGISRRNLWADLAKCGVNRKMDWLLLGDWNVVRCSEEKISSRDVNFNEVKEFNSILNHLELDDIRAAGPLHTRSNNQNGSDRIAIKLDGMMGNKVFNDGVKHYEALFNHPGISDHCVMVLKMGQNLVMKKPFHFLNAWTQDHQFLEVVEAGWKRKVEGSAMYSLVTKLKGLKEKLKVLHRSGFDRLKERVNLAYCRLVAAQERLSNDQNSVVWQHLEMEAREEYGRLLKVEHYALRQMYKAQEVKKGDESSKFFYSMIAQRRRSSNINCILDDEGDLVVRPDVIQGKLLKFFDDMLGKSEGSHEVDVNVVKRGAVLNDRAKEDLCKEVSKEEIKKALWEINDVKSPGPDGYTSCFFKKAWSMVGDDLVRAVLSFFKMGRLLR